MRRIILAAALSAAMVLPRLAAAAELILPDARNAYYSAESIELAVPGIEGAPVQVQIVPKDRSDLSPLIFEVTAAAPSVMLPPHTLAPGEYLVKAGGADAPLHIAGGVNVSTMLVSQTIGMNHFKEAGGNFILGNSFSWGVLEGDGQPAKNPRGKKSPGFNVFEQAVRMDQPTIVYMYWTGYVTHKPFGSEKSWANESMVEAMRLLNFSNAQRMRRFAKNIHAVGTLDEPGLSWARTPAGGMATGFPNWDEKPWYEQRGWQYTDDPASRPDDDWIKYMTIRCDIMRQNNQWAKEDLKTIWPDCVFSTDLYAPQAVMDGTDPLAQVVNDIPASHVFVDWGCGKLGAMSGVYLEKADDPTRKLAHAMNGQLFSTPVAQPTQQASYHLMLNAMMAAGLHSNWWLNMTGMKPAELAAVNEPAQRIGPVFQEMQLKNHDVAVLWSFTEIAMRCKDITAKEASKKSGEQIKLMVASLPEGVEVKDGQMDINAYSIGQNYKDQVLMAHQAMSRAGYPAHIIHERVLNKGVPQQYKTLVIIGQTFDLPADIRKALSDFVARGGKIVVDGTTTVKFDQAIVTDADLRDPGHRWGLLYRLAEKKDHEFKNNRQASYYHTNHFMDEMPRAAVASMKAAMQKTDSRPAVVTDSVWLAAEKHAAGEGALFMVINSHEQLPEIPEDQKYPIYNYAPYSAAYTLAGIPAGSAVYRIEGIDWKQAAQVNDFTSAQSGQFAAGEMKLYLVAPRAPQGLELAAQHAGGTLQIDASLVGVKMPWPITLSVRDPSGRALYQIHRATDAEGRYSETLPLGTNIAAGAYSIEIQSPVAGLSAKATAQVAPAPPAPQAIAHAVRVFDEQTIGKFLAAKPSVVIVAGDANPSQAQKLAAELSSRGVKATVKPESQVLRKARYPRVWNPFARLYTPSGEEKRPEKMDVQRQIELGLAADGTLTARASDGKDLGGDWKQPKSLVTIVGDGFVDFTGDHELCFEPGVQLYFNEQRQMSVIKGTMTSVPTTEQFKAKWSRPWTRLVHHVGAYQLPPELPEAYQADEHLILLGDSRSGSALAALQASEMLPRVVDEKYPGPGRAIVSFVWSPFAVEKNVIVVGGADDAALAAGAARLLELAPR